ncbi:MAG: tetratricopeptide repeat protein [Ectothiorhodospiraceae bacterium]|nr:tetratricopeptide repeat protein [Ectothiorhodospiraceae bacterium]
MKPVGARTSSPLGVEPNLTRAIHDALALCAEESGPPPSEPLDDLFRTLAEADDRSSRSEAEDLIWALWCSHADARAARAMRHAIGALSRGDLEAAGRLLDDLVVAQPDWAEAWNKRATVRFLEGRNAESVDDIVRTLRLEPRHFGALGGLGQICLRVGDETGALVAFEYALRRNPNLDSLREEVARLRPRLLRTLH